MRSGSAGLAIPNRDQVFHCLLDNRNRLNHQPAASSWISTGASAQAHAVQRAARGGVISAAWAETARGVMRHVRDQCEMKSDAAEPADCWTCRR